MAITINGNGTIGGATTLSSNVALADVTSDTLTVDTNTLVVDETNNRVGIGTSTPNTKLTVAGYSNTDSTNKLAIGDNADYQGLVYMESATETLTIENTSDYSSSATIFKTNGSEAMRIVSSGHLLVGTTTTTITSATSGTIVRSSGYFDTKRNTTSAASHHQFYNPNGYCGNIYTTGSSTVYATSSDYRLKENVVEVTDGIDRVKLLKPSRFNFIVDPDTTVDGFLAHEVQDIVPEAISGTKDAVDEEGNPEYQGIDQSKLVPLLTAALQEAITKIESLETEMVLVKSRLDILESA